jgi:hypothetical protein
MKVLRKVLRCVERIAHTIGVGAIAWIWVRPTEKSGSQPNFAGVEQQQKRLTIFLDGTWKYEVWRMRALCAPKSKERAAVAAWGTRLTFLLNAN